jgi:arylsulfatase A-like enzyme
MGGSSYCGALQDPLYSAQAVEFLADSASHATPWHLTVSLVNPHDICEFPRSYPAARVKPISTDAPPPNFADDLSTKPSIQRNWQSTYSLLFGYLKTDCADEWRRYLDYYCLFIQKMDRHLGLVLDALEKSGQAGDTIVCFTSDHGDMGGSHRLRAKGPMAYDEVMNVPLVFAWPGVIPAGKRTGAMASNVDVMPTLASLAGLRDLPYQSGLDLSPALLDPAADPGRGEVIFHMNGNPDPPDGQRSGRAFFSLFKSPNRLRALRDRQWKYVEYFAPGSEASEHELYDLNNDPLEMINLASDAGYQAKRREMAQRLGEEEARLRREFAS